MKIFLLIITLLSSLCSMDIAEAFTLRASSRDPYDGVVIADIADIDWGRARDGILLVVDEVEPSSEIGWLRVVRRISSGTVSVGDRMEIRCEMPSAARAIRIAARDLSRPEAIAICLLTAPGEAAEAQDQVHDFGIVVPDAPLTNALIRARASADPGDRSAPLAAALSEAAGRRVQSVSIPLWLAEACLRFLWGGDEALPVGPGVVISGDTVALPVMRSAAIRRASVTALTRETPIDAETMFLPTGEMCATVTSGDDAWDVILRCRPDTDLELGAIDMPFFGYSISDVRKR